MQLVYTRGIGWHYPTTTALEVTMYCGARVRLEVRKPKVGERYSTVSVHDIDYYEGTTLKEPWINYHLTGRLSYLAVWYDGDYYATVDVVYCVAVPV